MFSSSPSPDNVMALHGAFLLPNPSEQQARAQGVGLVFVISVSARLGQPMNPPQLFSSLLFLCPVLPRVVSHCFRKGHLFSAVQEAFGYTVKLLLHFHKWGNLWHYILKPGNRLWKIELLRSKHTGYCVKRELLHGCWAPVRKKGWGFFLGTAGKLKFNFFF